MGDIILTLPVVHNLRKQYPSAKISYLAAEPYNQLLFNHPDIDEVIGFNLNSLGDQVKAIYKLVSRNFDIGIDLFGNPRTALLTFLTGSKIRIGGDFRGRRHFYTHPISTQNKKLSSVEFHLNYLNPLGFAPELTMPKLFVTRSEDERAKDYLKKNGFDKGVPIVGIHAGATWPSKKWHANRFAELALLIKNKLGAEIFFTAGPNDVEYIKKMILNYSIPVKMPEILNIRELCAVIKQFSVFISNDCGPMHIAPAVGVPTIGIFGPGEPEVWFPYRKEDGHRTVHKNLECSRCGKDFCDNLKCMDAVSVNDVFREVSFLLENYGSRKK